MNKGAVEEFQSKMETPKTKNRDFPGGPVVKTPHSQCRGHRFNPRLGN